jgi:hypothetical protein
MFIKKSDYSAAAGLESGLMGPSLGGSTSLHVTLTLHFNSKKQKLAQQPRMS